jgi:nucleotide-binding universal stress UspA family protein
MFDKILLPLDGSELSESAIPYVRDLAARLKAEVRLLHVCPPGHQNLVRMHSIYLNYVAESLKKEIKDLWGIEIPGLQAEVITGEEPARAISEYVQKNSINLVVMTTRGASGIRALTIGSVADKVVRGLGIPTLLIRINGKTPVPQKKGLIQRILVPLDSSEASKIAVPYAVDFARKLQASITLFSMAETIYARNLDGMNAGVGVNWDEIDAATLKYLEEYLQSIENEVKSQGVAVEHVTKLGIDAASEILELEKKIPIDLIIMATRGRSPVARWAFGSTAEKILREGQIPLMVIREAGH